MLRTVVKLSVLAVLVYAGVYLWYDRVVGRLEQGVSQSPKPVVETREPQAEQDVVVEGDDYQIIIERNIFQAKVEATASEVIEEEPEEVVELEETTLQLTLLGTVAGNERDARAIIIDDKEKKQDIFQIGDAVQGAFITEIDRGKVVLEVNGKKEVLTIKDREGGGPAAPGVGGNQPPQNVTRQSPAANQRVPVARPRRRINFKQSQPAVVEQAEPAEPLAVEDIEEAEAELVIDEEVEPTTEGIDPEPAEPPE